MSIPFSAYFKPIHILLMTGLVIGFMSLAFATGAFATGGGDGGGGGGAESGGGSDDAGANVRRRKNVLGKRRIRGRGGYRRVYKYKKKRRRVRRAKKPKKIRKAWRRPARRRPAWTPPSVTGPPETASRGERDPFEGTGMTSEPAWQPPTVSVGPSYVPPGQTLPGTPVTTPGAPTITFPTSKIPNFPPPRSPPPWDSENPLGSRDLSTYDPSHITVPDEHAATRARILGPDHVGAPVLSKPNMENIKAIAGHVLNVLPGSAAKLSGNALTAIDFVNKGVDLTTAENAEDFVAGSDEFGRTAAQTAGALEGGTLGIPGGAAGIFVGSLVGKYAGGIAYDAATAARDAAMNARSKR